MFVEHLLYNIGIVTNSHIIYILTIQTNWSWSKWAAPPWHVLLTWGTFNLKNVPYGYSSD